jgi:hypothetical protein
MVLTISIPIITQLQNSPVDENAIADWKDMSSAIADWKDMSSALSVKWPTTSLLVQHATQN